MRCMSACALQEVDKQVGLQLLYVAANATYSNDVHISKMQWFGQHQSIATSCCCSQHHQLVAVGLDKSAVSLWDLRSGEEEAELLG